MLGLIAYEDSDEEGSSDEGTTRRRSSRTSGHEPTRDGDVEEGEITELPEAPPSRVSSTQQMELAAARSRQMYEEDEEWMEESEAGLAKRVRIDSEAWTGGWDNERIATADDDAEPPPPRRAESMASPSPGYGTSAVPSPIVSTRVESNLGRLVGSVSQTSLVEYGEEEERRQSREEDEFSRVEIAERKASRNRGSDNARHAALDDDDAAPREPSAPHRPSTDAAGDDGESPGELEIDQVLEQAMALTQKIDVQDAAAQPAHATISSFETDSNTPRSCPGEDDSPRLAESRVAIDEIRIPPAPDAKCDPQIEKLFENEFRKKSLGYDHNRRIRSNKEFANPSMYEKLIEMFEVDECGTNFEKHVFDPRGFPSDCFYEKLAEQQKRLMDALPAGDKKPSTLPVGSKTQASASDVAKARKSRFEESRKK